MPVFVAASAPAEERQAAKELARVLSKMSGLDWPIYDAAEGGPPGFYIGSCGDSQHTRKIRLAKDWLRPEAGEIGPDGFRIQTVSGSVYIESATPEATLIAVSWFLQSEAGVRWYAPGPLGEIIPPRTHWELRELDRIVQPGYLSRDISGLITPAEKVWGLHNGLYRRFDFGHAIGRVFTPKILSDHPEWRPVVKGKVFLPRSEDDSDWQPNLAIPSAADFSANCAIQALAQERSAMAFSLGLNDSTCFDESELTSRKVEPLHYFRGQPDYSGLVFEFMNRAAALFESQQPDRYLTCLAYQWWQNAPSFPLRRSIIPILTSDRSQYYSSAFRTEDLDLMKRWGHSGVQAFGLWDYAYGKNFLVPREPIHAWAESLQRGWQNGARIYFSEIESNLGFDVFKMWVIAQLTWDPARSYESLATDFFRGYYGAAAVPMRQFFEGCENRWMHQSGDPIWLKYYQQADQALIFPRDVCWNLRRKLQTAATIARADQAVSARIEQTSRAFAVTEALAELEEKRQVLIEWNESAIAHRNEALAIEMSEFLNAENHLKVRLSESINGESPAMGEVDITNYIKNDPVPRLLLHTKRSDPLGAEKIFLNAGNLTQAKSDWRSIVELEVEPSSVNLLKNSSFNRFTRQIPDPQFLHPLDKMLPSGWVFRARAAEKESASTTPTAERTIRSFRISGAIDTQLYQWLPAVRDQVYLLTAELRGQASPGNESALFLSFLSAGGERLGEERMESLPKGLTESFRELVLAGTAPEKTAWIGVGVGIARQSRLDWLEVKKMELHRLTRPVSHETKF